MQFITPFGTYIKQAKCTYIYQYVGVTICIATYESTVDIGGNALVGSEPWTCKIQ